MEHSKVIVFDLDGTLLDSAAGIIDSLSFAVRELGHEVRPDPTVKHLLGPPMPQIVAELLRPFNDDRVEQCVAIYREHYRQHGLYNCRPYAGTQHVLQQLRNSGWRLFVATSKRQPFAELALAHTGLIDYFEQVRGTPVDGSMDDKGELLAALLAEVFPRPTKLWMVGDKRDDMLAARHNRVGAIGALWGYGSVAELTDGGAWYLINCLAELPGAVE